MIAIRVTSAAFAILSLVSVSSSRAQSVGREDVVFPGGFCVNSRHVSDFLSPLSNAEPRFRPVRLAASHNANQDYSCYGRGVFIHIPPGLEAYYAGVFFERFGERVVWPRGTAGGGYYSKRRIPISALVNAIPTSETANSSLREVRCRIETRLKEVFQGVQLSLCRSSERDGPEGFCFEGLVGGHLSDGRGLRRTDISSRIDDGFFYSVRFGIVSGFLTNYLDNNSRNVGTVARADIYVRNARFARGARGSASPTPEYFQSIERFVPGIEIENVDDSIAARIAELLFDRGALSCRES